MTSATDNRTTETEVIRELLDVRGVKYFKRDIGSERFTAWGRKDANRVTFFESGIGTPLHRTYFTAENITAEQAVAAILSDEV